MEADTDTGHMYLLLMTVLLVAAIAMLDDESCICSSVVMWSIPAKTCCTIT